MPKSRSLLGTVGSISSATMLSRVLGLVRDQVQAYYFGAGFVTDAFVAAFRVPNLLRDLFAEGALSAAFVPTFTAERERSGDAAAWRLANRVMAALAVILTAVAAVIMLAAPQILGLYVAGFGPDKMELCITMTRILAPFLLFVALAAVAMGALNTFGRFFLPALAPASFNVAAIAGVLLLVPVLPRFGLHPGLSLAIGALVGGALQFLVQLPALRLEGFRLRPELSTRNPALRRIGRLMLPATFGLAATQINIFVDTLLASSYEGAITWLQYAFRLLQLPIGLFGVAIATANLARVSRDAARGDDAGMRANLAASLRAAALLALPSMAGLIALREPIVRVLFEHGRFTPESTDRTAAAVLCYALGLFAYAVTKIQVPTFYALGETRTPVQASVAAVTIKVAASFLFIRLLDRAGIEPFLGLALSTSLAAWINFGWLAYRLRARLGPLSGERVLVTFLQLTVVSLLVGLAALQAHTALRRLIDGEGLPAEIVGLAGAILAGAVTWGLGVWLLGVPEARRLIRRFTGSPR